VRHFRKGFLPCRASAIRSGSRCFGKQPRSTAKGAAEAAPFAPSTDCLIAAIAIDNGVPVWHRDRDFDAIAQYTPLRVTWDLRHVSSEESTHSATIGPSPRDNSASIVSRRLPAVATADSIAIQ